jgi:predicted nucleic acid-binding protein
LVKLRRVLLDSNIFGVAIDDEDDYDPRSFEYWEILSVKTIFKIIGRITLCGCPAVELELRNAPEPLKNMLLNIYSSVKSLKTNSLVIKLSREYEDAGIYTPDAIILAYSPAHRVDALVTINRRHLNNPLTLKKIKRINRKYRLPELRVLFPSELLEFLRKRG